MEKQKSKMYMPVANQKTLSTPMNEKLPFNCVIQWQQSKFTKHVQAYKPQVPTQQTHNEPPFKIHTVPQTILRAKGRKHHRNCNLNSDDDDRDKT